MDTKRPSRRRFAPLIALSLALVLVAGACTSSDSTSKTSAPTSTTPRDGGSVVMAVDQETDGWNPSVSQWTGAAYWVGSSVIEPLATFDEHGEAVMWLADSITPTVPGAYDSWLIKVKPNITFHNGELLNADVLKLNLDLLTNGKSLSGVALGPKFKAFTKIDEMTVQVDINGPWADFPSFMAGPSGMIMAKAMIEAPFGGIDHPVGTGPFVFQSWTPKVSFKATKNTNYWRPGEPHLDSIEFRPFTDNKEALSALQNSDVDMIVTTKAEDVALAGQGLIAQKDYKTEKTFVLLNTDQYPGRAANPLTNVHARRALAYGTDRAAIRAQVGAGEQIETSTQPMVSGTPWAVPEDQTGYNAFDVAKAKTEVEAYTSDTGSPTIEFDLNTTTAPDDLAIANALADQWKAIGVTANVRGKELQASVADTVFGNYEAVVQRNYGYPNPDTNTAFFVSSNAKGPGQLSVNFSQIRNDAIDAAIADAQSTTDRAKQRDDWLTITRQINDQAINLWLYDTPYAVIHTPSVRGLESLDTHSFASSVPRPWLWGNVWHE